jgi:O-antigen ligase
VGGFVLGAASGLASVVVHDKSWVWLVLALAAPIAMALAFAPGLLRVAFVAGWFTLLALAVFGRPEGDYAIRSSERGYVLLGGGMVLLGLAVATVRRPVRTSP